jgi:uncharacterized membrane protein HdeD (DUF308 family)
MTSIRELKEYRWSLALRGIAAIIFGVLAYSWPSITLMVLLIAFGVYALVDGLSLLVGYYSTPKSQRDWWLVPLIGVFSILIGILTFARPGMTAILLLWLIAARAIFTGIIEIAAAFGYWRKVRGEWLLVLGGLISVLFGVFVFAYPLEGALAVIWVIALYAILYGITQLFFGLFARQLAAGFEEGLPHPPVAT